MIPYGRKTGILFNISTNPFEGSVIPYGRKTVSAIRVRCIWFEGSVIPYGRKTFCHSFSPS